MRDRWNFSEKIVARKKKRKRRRRRSRWRKKRESGSGGNEKKNNGDNDGIVKERIVVDEESRRRFENPGLFEFGQKDNYEIWPGIRDLSGDREIGGLPRGNRGVVEGGSTSISKVPKAHEVQKKGNNESMVGKIESKSEETLTAEESAESLERRQLNEKGDWNNLLINICPRCEDSKSVEKLVKYGNHLKRAVVNKSANFVSTLVTIVFTASCLFIVALGHENSHAPVGAGNVAGIAEAFAGGPVKYSTRIVRTRYGTLRGIVTRDNDLEAYLGVPYATPPLGALRYMPPVTPTQWRGVKHADSMPPVCPQRKYHLIDDSSATGSRRGDDFSSPLVRSNQSEDCLYLNLYVPRSNRGNGTELLPALLLVHGESYSWGEGNSLVGTALASHGHLVVVSINFRLGILGSKGSGQGNYGLMDLVAGLHWLRENLEAFGGDPQRMSVLGHGTGAALANFLAVSPMAKELIDRVVLLGGSALSPWAIQRDPLAIKRRVAEQTGCPSDVETDDIAACLRLCSLDQLLKVNLDSPRFTAGFAPFVDGTVLPLTSAGNVQPTVGSSGLFPIAPGPGVEFASFGNRHLLMGLTSDEAWFDLNDEDMRNGLNETRRDRILRTYVRNTYRYHLHEIYSTLRNEYTDWERGEQSPAGIREALLALLGDGQVAAPLLRLALLHSASGARGYLLHFQPGDRPSRKGEELPYLLGIPLLRNEAANSPSIAPVSGNYTAADENLSRLLVRYLANFIWRGDPNDNGAESPPFWDVYDSINQYYLEVGGATTTKMRSHYRGHKMSLWLNLLPQLHRPGYEISMRHHHLAESPSLYEGAVRPQTMVMPIPAPPLTIPSPTEASMSPLPVLTTECAPNEIGQSTPSTASTLAGISEDDVDSRLGPGPNNLLRKFASNHYQSYTTALTVTIAVGIFLLLLNILIFAGIYHQRDRNAAAAAVTSGSSYRAGKKEDSLEAGCSGLDLPSNKSRLTASLVNSDSPPMSSSPPIHKQKLVQQLELELQEFQCSPPPGGTIGGSGKRISTIDPPNYGWPDPPRTPSPCVDVAAGNNADEDDDNDEDDDDDDDDDDEDDDDDDDNDDDLEENLPEPPPPPKAPAPNVAACPGILRQPGTPGSAKKRVQIQEISV